MTIPVQTLRPEQLDDVDRWLRSVLWDSKLPGKEDSKFEIHRSKGRLVLDDGRVKMLQGVQEIFELMNAPEGVESTQTGKIIFIGKHIADVDFEGSFRATVK